MAIPGEAYVYWTWRVVCRLRKLVKKELISMPPSDPACPTCGTQVRANDYWSYLAGPSSPRVYYPKSIMDDNPEIAGTFTRCADPFHAAPSDPTTAPPPEWALDAAHEYFRDQWGPLGIPTVVAVNVAPLARLLASVREAAIRDAGATSADVMDIYKQRQADTRKTLPFGWTIFAGRTRDRWREQVGAGIGAMVCRDAILSLLHTPPSGGAG